MTSDREPHVSPSPCIMMTVAVCFLTAGTIRAGAEIDMMSTVPVIGLGPGGFVQYGTVQKNRWRSEGPKHRICTRTSVRRSAGARRGTEDAYVSYMSYRTVCLTGPEDSATLRVVVPYRYVCIEYSYEVRYVLVRAPIKVLELIRNPVLIVAVSSSYTGTARDLISRNISETFDLRSGPATPGDLLQGYQWVYCTHMPGIAKQRGTDARLLDRLVRLSSGLTRKEMRSMFANGVLRYLTTHASLTSCTLNLMALAATARYLVKGQGQGMRCHAMG